MRRPPAVQNRRLTCAGKLFDAAGCDRSRSWQRPKRRLLKRRFLARPTDRAGARRRSRGSPAGWERRSLGRPEAAKRPRRPRRRGGRLIPPARPRQRADIRFYRNNA